MRSIPPTVDGHFIKLDSALERALTTRTGSRSCMKPPYKTVLKPYGEALLALARRRPEVLCLGADLTRQTETDIFRDAIPDRFINIGMAEANMIGIAGGLARAGHTVFVNTFGVFCTRRCYDQIAMAVAYPKSEREDRGFHAGSVEPGRPQPPSDRGRGVDAGAAEHDSDRSGRRA